MTSSYPSTSSGDPTVPSEIVHQSTEYSHVFIRQEASHLLFQYLSDPSICAKRLEAMGEALLRHIEDVADGNPKSAHFLLNMGMSFSNVGDFLSRIPVYHKSWVSFLKEGGAVIAGGAARAAIFGGDYNDVDVWYLNGRDGHRAVHVPLVDEPIFVVNRSTLYVSGYHPVHMMYVPQRSVNNLVVSFDADYVKVALTSDGIHLTVGALIANLMKRAMADNRDFPKGGGIDIYDMSPMFDSSEERHIARAAKAIAKGFDVSPPSLKEAATHLTHIVQEVYQWSTRADMEDIAIKMNSDGYASEIHILEPFKFTPLGK